MPYQMLVDTYLPLITKERINPEIGFDCFVLDRYKRSNFTDTAKRIKDQGLSVTFHAPFFDLRPGALDRKVREVTIERLKEVFDLVPLFSPKSVVCHASFDEKYYVSKENEWLENSRETWSHFLGIAEEMDTMIAIENVYETAPLHLKSLLDTFGESSRISLCFDTGHFNAFSGEPLDSWMEEIGSHIGQLHLHDNKGSKDEHVAVGEGTFPFNEFFQHLKNNQKRPIITIEPHDEATLWRTLENIERMSLLDGLI
jgi:sugar phosphate isomerase/epimerase